MADPLLALNAELGDPVLVVGLEERSQWHQPIVYAWLRDEEVLYVGCSTVGVERPLSAKHEKLRDFQAGDRLAVWSCANPYTLEDALIRRWRPRYNLPPGGVPCPDCGGRWKVIERSVGRCRLCQGRAANGAPPLRQSRLTM